MQWEFNFEELKHIKAQYVHIRINEKLEQWLASEMAQEQHRRLEALGVRGQTSSE